MSWISKSIWTVVTAVAVAGVAFAGPTRIPDGTTIEVCTKVRLPSDMTTTARLMECDPGKDDDMGPASVGSDGKISAAITNSGGHLSGPNGVTQTGHGEGQEIEVKFRLTQTKQAEISLPFGFSFPVTYVNEFDIKVGTFIGT